MDIKKAEFIISNTEWQKCPKPVFPEYAFIGRSNVGKSSLINMLTNRKSLAKVSGTPGKTQLINHFLINDSWYLVDLPGYGYAKVSKNLRNKFQTFTLSYLKNRSNLMCLVVLVDGRHSPQNIDKEFMEYCAVNGIPFIICLTKMDKLRNSEKAAKVEGYKLVLLKEWEELPKIIETSSARGEGKEELLDFISETNKLFEY